MALGIDELNTVSKKYFDPTLKQQVYDDSPFMALLKKRHQIKLGGGVKIQWGIRYQSLALADATDPRAQIIFQTKQTRTGAELDWAYYTVPAMLHWDEQAKNSGPGRIVNLLEDKTKEQKEDINDVLCTALFSTSPATANDIQPLDDIVDSATTYAGIAVSDAAKWAAQENSTTTTLNIFGTSSLTYYRNLCTFGKNLPSLHITTRDLASKFESLLQPQQRYEDKEMANLGFANVTFYGKPVIGDYYCPANAWFGLDIGQFELFVHKDYNFDTGKGWFSLEQAGYPNAVGRVVSWQGNLKCYCRKTSFKYTALDYTK